MPSSASSAGSVRPIVPARIDWNIVRQEVTDHLQRLLRFDTTNPPGNELPLARHLHEVLEAAGIESRLLEPAAGRGAVIARIPGSGDKRPVLLLAHMDVVGVERERWSLDPFGGEIHEGYLYGRGAIDDKGMLATNLTTILLLKRQLTDAGAALTRDVVFVATSDEEAGGTYGIGWLIEHHPDLIQGEFALNEGGRIRIVGDRPLYAAVQVAEKVTHMVEVTARGPSGHASIPLSDNAVARLARAVAAIASHREALNLLPATQRFFADLSSVWPDIAQAQAMADIASDDPARRAHGEMVLGDIPALDALLRSGISPTMLHAGIAGNVIPAEARATLNVRTLPEDSIEPIIDRLRRVVNDSSVEIAVTSSGHAAPVSDFGSEMFTAIRDTLRELAPSVLAVPYLSTGATDSARLRAVGVQAFGLLPFPLAEADEKRMHGHDERISLEALEFGTRLTFGLVLRMAS